MQVDINFSTDTPFIRHDAWLSVQWMQNNGSYNSKQKSLQITVQPCENIGYQQYWKHHEFDVDISKSLKLKRLECVTVTSQNSKGSVQMYRHLYIRLTEAKWVWLNTENVALRKRIECFELEEVRDDDDDDDDDEQKEQKMAIIRIQK